MFLVELQLFSASMLDPNRVTPPSTLKALDVWGTSLDPSEDLYRGGRFSSLVVLRLQIMASCPHDTWEYFIRGLPNLKCLEISRALSRRTVPPMSESIDLNFFESLQKDIVEYRLHIELPLPLHTYKNEVYVSTERLVSHWLRWYGNINVLTRHFPFQGHFDFVPFHIEILACYPSFLRSKLCEDETDGEPTGRVWLTKCRNSSFSRVRALGGPLDEEIVQSGEGPG